MKLGEHHLGVQGGPSVYVGGDDTDSDDMRLSVMTGHVFLHVDLLPKDMARIRDLINDALDEAGLCPHGWEDSCICPHCAAEQP